MERIKLIETLATLTERDEAGRHFTEICDYLDELEVAGWIKIDRPVHEVTGIAYDRQYWHLEITEAGVAAVEAAGPRATYMLRYANGHYEGGWPSMDAALERYTDLEPDAAHEVTRCDSGNEIRCWPSQVELDSDVEGAYPDATIEVER